ncbi:hypothetical protein H0H93_000361 [Arthromyces matolae]|nr:hypothetical protein H0H93_000361 [Arthromyces matolae]
MYHLQQVPQAGQKGIYTFSTALITINMSLGEADGKFPTANEGTSLPPPATPENPGQVLRFPVP